MHKLKNSLLYYINGFAALLVYKGISGAKAIIAGLPLLFLDISVSFINSQNEY